MSALPGTEEGEHTGAFTQLRSPPDILEEIEALLEYSSFVSRVLKNSDDELMHAIAEKIAARVRRRLHAFS